MAESLSQTLLLKKKKKKAVCDLKVPRAGLDGSAGGEGPNFGGSADKTGE